MINDKPNLNELQTFLTFLKTRISIQLTVGAVKRIRVQSSPRCVRENGVVRKLLSDEWIQPTPNSPDFRKVGLTLAHGTCGSVPQPLQSLKSEGGLEQKYWSMKCSVCLYLPTASQGRYGGGGGGAAAAGRGGGGGVRGAGAGVSSSLTHSPFFKGRRWCWRRQVSPVPRWHEILLRGILFKWRGRKEKQGNNETEYLLRNTWRQRNERVLI